MPKSSQYYISIIVAVLISSSIKQIEHQIKRKRALNEQKTANN